MRQHNLDETFYVFNLGLVAQLHRGWAECLPRVTPFYAVKCNPDRGMLAMLAAQGAGFDCASAAEIDLILGLGVPADRIIYAHPCKPMSHIRHAAKVSSPADVCGLHDDACMTTLMSLAVAAKQRSFLQVCCQPRLHMMVP